MADQYLWICPQCRYRNSRFSQKCFRCLKPNAGASAQPKPRITRLTAERPRPASSSVAVVSNSINQVKKEPIPGPEAGDSGVVVKPIKWTTVERRPSESCVEVEVTAQPVIRRCRGQLTRLLAQHRGSAYSDVEFAPNRSSLYREHEDCDPRYDQLVTQWLRIKQLSQQPNCVHRHGVLDQAARFQQGQLGDCWLMAALISLVHKCPKQLDTLIPDPEIHLDECCYQIYLCLDGHWTALLIDDLFPCDRNGRMVFAEAVGDQFFAPLIEKALAKHYSCYMSLVSGRSTEGFSNLTGMPVRRIAMPESPSAAADQLWRELQHYVAQCRYPVTASCKEARCGLFSNHAYAILEVAEMAAGRRRLILLSNPWGNQELKGELALNHRIVCRDRSLPNGQGQGQGLFWLRYEDLLRSFSSIDVCKWRRNWHAYRFQFRLPFGLDDGKNLTAFEVLTRAKCTLELTVYQPSDRNLPTKSRLSISIMVLKRWPDKSLQLVTNSPVMRDKIENFELLLGQGQFLLLVVAFNHWGYTSRLKEAPRLTLAVHTEQRSVTVKPVRADMHLLGDALIRACQSGSLTEAGGGNFREYQLGINSDFAAFVMMAENREPENHLLVEWNTNGSVNAFNVRPRSQGHDLLPPMSCQIVCIMARQSDKLSCNYRYCSRLRSVPPGTLKQPANEDVHRLPALFGPRVIEPQSLAERNRGRPFEFGAEKEPSSGCTIV